jgi:hypothetical protein
MPNNPQNPIIICYASKEMSVDHDKQYLVITDKGGQKHKISEKRQALWALFNNARDAEPFMLVYETYNNIQYVADARPITDELLSIAVQSMGLKLADVQTEEKNRSTALSYAKDMVVSGAVKLEDLYSRARANYDFIKNVEAK